LLGLSRGSFYYHPLPVSAEEAGLMRQIDEAYTQSPFYGSRRSPCS
jgi:putative transposase